MTPITNDPKDFDVAITNSDYLVLDNADSRSDWLEGRLAIIATGGSIKKRALYSDNKLIDFKPSCFVGITSRTPKFNRDDIADRPIIFKVKRLGKYILENVLTCEILDNRDRIMFDVIYRLQKILKKIKMFNQEIYEGSFRIADFVQMASKVREEDVEKEDLFDAGISRVEKLLSKLREEQSNLALSTEPIVDLITMWVNESIRSRKFITNKELCGELSKIADNISFKFGYKNNHRGFAQKMSNIRTNLETVFDIEEKSFGGRVTKFRYTLKELEDDDYNNVDMESKKNR